MLCKSQNVFKFNFDLISLDAIENLKIPILDIENLKIPNIDISFFRLVGIETLLRFTLVVFLKT